MGIAVIRGLCTFLLAFSDWLGSMTYRLRNILNSMFAHQFTLPIYFFSLCDITEWEQKWASNRMGILSLRIQGYVALWAYRDLLGKHIDPYLNI